MAEQLSVDMDLAWDVTQALTPETVLAFWKADRSSELIEQIRQALRPSEQIGQPVDATWRIAALEGLAELLYKVHRRPEYVETLEQLLVVQEAALGERHLDLVGALTSLAFQRGMGATLDRQRAEQLFRRALGIAEATNGPDDDTVAECLRMLGVNLMFRKKYPESEAALVRACAYYEKTNLRKTATRLTAVLSCLHLTYYGWERHADAERVLRRELELTEQYDNDGLQVGSVLQKLADAIERQGKHEEAIEAYDRALAQDNRYFRQILNARQFRAPRNPGGGGTFRSYRATRRAHMLLHRGTSLRALGREEEARANLLQAERSIRRRIRLESRLGHRSFYSLAADARLLSQVLTTRGKPAQLSPALEAALTEEAAFIAEIRAMRNDA